jgi:hypothetical protein
LVTYNSLTGGFLRLHKVKTVLELADELFGVLDWSPIHSPTIPQRGVKPEL